MATLAAPSQHARAHGRRADPGGGVVMCLFESSPQWSRTLRAATVLADALGDRLVVDPGASRRWPLRGRLERSRGMARAVGAEILVTGSAQTTFGRLIAPHRRAPARFLSTIAAMMSANARSLIR
jgi:hypothetical protein